MLGIHSRIHASNLIGIHAWELVLGYMLGMHARSARRYARSPHGDAWRAPNWATGGGMESFAPGCRLDGVLGGPSMEALAWRS